MKHITYMKPMKDTIFAAPLFRLMAVRMLVWLIASLSHTAAMASADTQAAYEAAKRYFSEQHLSASLTHEMQQAPQTLPPVSEKPPERDWYQQPDALSRAASEGVRSPGSIGATLRESTETRPQTVIPSAILHSDALNTLQHHAPELLSGEDAACDPNATPHLPCGQAMPCLGGECDSITPAVSHDFNPSVTALGTLAAMGEDIRSQELTPHEAQTPSEVRLFSGKALRCRDVTLGTLNCCRNHGWAKGMVMHCRPEEGELGRARQHGGLVVSLGRYCAHRHFGFCTEHKQSYCVFPSRVAADIQIQGRAQQLHRHFGVATSPDCSGLTVEEVQSLDWSPIDFSNAAEDIRQGVALPSDTLVRQRIEQQLAQQSLSLALTGVSP